MKSTENFQQRLARLEPMTLTAEELSETARMQPLVSPKVVSIHGRSVGVLDGVATELFRQGLASTRLLVALNDQLIDVMCALRKGDTSPLHAFVLEVDGVLSATGAHIKVTYDSIESAQAESDRIRLSNPEAKS